MAGILDEINQSLLEENDKVGQNTLDEINAALGFTPPQPPGLATEFGRGFVRSGYGTIGLLTGGPQALYGLATGSEENKRAGLERIADWAKTGQEEYPASVENLDKLLDDPTPGNIARYIAGGTGELASMIPTMGGAGLGVGLARGIASKAAERAVERAVSSGAIKATEKEALAALAKNTEAKVLKNAALMGAVPPAALMNTAESYASLAERGGDNELGLTLAAGTAKTMLDTLAAVPILGGLLRGVSVGAVRGGIEKSLGKVLGNAVMGFMAEGSTEALQELIDVAAEEVVKPHSETASQLALRVLDVGIKGGLGGMALGGVGGALSRNEITTEGVDKQLDANQTGAKEREAYYARPEEIDAATAKEILQANREYARALDIRPSQLDEAGEIEAAGRIREAIAKDIAAQRLVEELEGRGIERGQQIKKDVLTVDELEEAVAAGVAEQKGRKFYYKGMPQETIDRLQESDPEVQRIRAEMAREAAVPREDLPAERVGRAEFYQRPDIRGISEFDEMGGPRQPEGLGSVPTPTDIPTGTLNEAGTQNLTEGPTPLSQAEVTYRDWVAKRQQQGLPIDEMAWVETFGQPMPSTVKELMWSEVGDMQAPPEPNVSALRTETQEFYGPVRRPEQAREGEVDWRDLKANQGRVFQAFQSAPIEKKRELAQQLRKLLVKWLGKNHYRVNFVNGDILVNDEQGNEYSLGGYTYTHTGIGHLAKVTLDQMDPEGSTAHEAFHMAVLLGIVRPGELQQLLANKNELRSLIDKARQKGWRPNTPIEEEITQDGMLAGLSKADHELLAYSLEAYKFLKENGEQQPAKGIVGRILERIQNFFADLGLWMRRSDVAKNAIYDAFLEGQMADREIAANQKPGSNYDLLAAINNVMPKEGVNSADDGRAMSSYAKLFNHASMIAQKYPAARPLVNAVIKMNDTRNEIMFDAEQLLKPLHNLPSESASRVNEFIIEGDKLGQWAKPGPNNSLQVGSLQLTDPKEIEAYEGFKKASLLMKDKLIKAFKQRMGLMDKDNPDTVLRKAARAKGADKIFYQRVSEVLQGLMDREGYMPHMRAGNHWIVVKDAKGEVIHAEKFFMPVVRKEQRIKEMTERLKQMYPQGIVSEPFRDSRGAMGANLLGAVGALEGIANAYGLAEGKEIDNFFKELKLALATKGFRGNLRKRNNIPGYITPQNRENYARNAFDAYLPSAANFISKQLHAHEFDMGLKMVQDSRDTKLKQWADNLMTYISSPAEESSWIRMFAFHALLGFNLSSAMLNVTQIPLALVPFLKQFKGPAPDGVTLKAFTDALKAFDVKRAVSNAGMHFSEKPTHLSQEEFKFLQDLERVGVVQPVLKQEYEAQAMQNLQRWGLESGPAAKGVAKMLSMYLKLSAGFFGISEQVNRVAAGLAAYRLGQNAEFLAKVQPTWDKSRMAGQPLTAESFARWAIEETQGTFGKGNRPEFMRGNIFSVATQFMVYPFMMIELLGKFLKEYDKEGFFKWGPGKMGALFMLGGLWVAGGLLAQPGADLARRFIELTANLFGNRIDLDYTMRKMLSEVGLGPRAADVLMRGLFRLGPMDISKRVDINPLKIEQFSESTGESLAGPAGGALAGMLSQVVRDYRQGHYGKMFLDVMPLAVRNVSEAIEAGSEGFKDSKGKVIKPASQVTTGEQIVKGMGFTPTEIGRARELRQFATNVVEATKGKQQDFALKISDAIYDRANAIREGKPEKAAAALKKQQEVMQEIVEYNKGRKASELLNVKSIIESAKKQAQEALTGGYTSAERAKRASKNKRGEIRDIMDMYRKD